MVDVSNSKFEQHTVMVTDKPEISANKYTGTINIWWIYVETGVILLKKIAIKIVS